MSIPTKNTVTQELIDSILAGSTFEDTKLGSKSTVVLCVLPNGFQIIESSSCVDPANYDHNLGVQLAKKRIAERVWMLEGYLMQQRMCDMSACVAQQAYPASPGPHDQAEEAAKP